MKQIMVVKRRGQNEHLKQGDEQKQIYILQLNLTLIYKHYYFVSRVSNIFYVSM